MVVPNQYFRCYTAPRTLQKLKVKKFLCSVSVCEIKNLPINNIAKSYLADIFKVKFVLGI